MAMAVTKPGWSVRRGRLSWRTRGLRRLLRKPIVARRHADLTPADVALASYPRSGSNWLRYMLMDLLIGRDGNADGSSDASSISVHTAAPFVGVHGKAARVLPSGGRLIKTHERWRPEYRRGVYLVRHPMEAMLSYYSQARVVLYPGIDLKRFARAWARGKVDGYGDWRQNLESWLDSPVPVHLVRFEDLLADAEAELREILGFLGVSRTPQSIRQAVADNSFERMRKGQEQFIGQRFGPSLAAVPSTSTGAAEKASELLDDEDLDLLGQRLGDGMERLGYALERTAAPG